MTTARRFQPANEAANDVDPAATPDRVLSCMAGFYRNEAQARAVLRQVRQAQGLLPTQSMLLSPADASLLRFARMSRLWASGHGGERSRRIGDGWMAGALGASLAILAALALLGRGWLPFDTWQVLMLLIALGLVGLLGVGLLTLGVSRPRPAHRFDEQVRRQLGLGYWALVAHRVPWAAQAGVITLLRSTSRRWCAMASHSQRLRARR